jgi:glycosyltransferase involved in cell wall biosynthesis
MIMKVGIHFFTTGEDIGGGFTYGEQIIKAIGKMAMNGKHQIVLFTPHSLSFVEKHSFFSEIIIPRDIPPSFLFRLKRYAKRKLRMRVDEPLNTLQTLILKEAPDLIYFIDPFHAIDTDVPHMVTVWDLQHRLQPWFPEVRIINTWEKRERMYSKLLGKAFQIIVGNETGKNELMMFYGIPASHISIMPHPTPAFAIEAGKGDDRILEKFNLKSGAFVFYPAQFWAHKNHILILDAIALLKSGGHLLKAVFSGSDKGNKTYIQKMAVKMGIADLIVFAGFVEREELIALYRNAFALTYPSYFGPENLPPLEAFALECPVIAADASGIREQLSDAALFFNPENANELVEQIMALYKPELKIELIRKGLEISGTRTVEKFAKDFYGILDRFETLRRTWL